MQKRQPINLKRIIVYPMLFTFIMIVICIALAFSLVVSRFELSIHNSTETTLTIFSRQITDHLEMKKEIIDNIDNTLLTTGRVVIQNRDYLDNDYLNELAHMSIVTEIYWYNPSGVVLFDTQSEYVGWTAQVGDPVHNFMMSGLDEYVEDVRQSTEEENFYKFVYLRASDGYFVQVGIEAEAFMAEIAQYEYQYILEQFLQEHDDILYALIVNTQFIALADTDEEDIGTDYTGDSDYIKALGGETVLAHRHYPQIDKEVLEVATPIYFNDVVIGLIALGYSRDFYVETKSWIALMFVIFGVIMASIYISFQITQIVTPVRQLNKDIDQLDIDNIHTDLFKKNKHALAGLYDTLDILTNKIDASNKKNAELNNELSRLAYYDYLTNIPNRIAFYEVINDYIKENRRFAVLYIDLDDFKAYNDTKGHTFGDKLLLSVAEEINALIDENIFVARHGGDEFLLAMKFNEDKEVEQLINRVRSIFEKGFKIEEALYFVAYSLGISLYPEHGSNPEELIRKADVAMYFVKKVEDKSYALYNQKMDKKMEDSVTVVETLKNAIKNDGFTIVYQPQVNIDSNTIVGAEALIMLNDGSISPEIFIPAAEQAGLIGIIGRYSIKKVIEQIAYWKSEGINTVPISVNMSSKQLDDDGIIIYIEQLLNQYHVEPSSLGVEITESAVIEKTSKAIAVLAKMRKMGIKTSIDDFGSGQAGINYLTRFHVDYVKLDKVFSDKYLNTEQLQIFLAVIHLCKLLGFSVLAEGIETSQQIELLKQTDCRVVQGYIYYKSMSAIELLALMKEQQ